jgi:HlyD family secretion protein
MNRRRVIPIVLLLLVDPSSPAFVMLRRNGNTGPFEGSGTVEATESELGFTAAGRIEVVTVVEGDTVARGAELARLDQSELAARRDQAAATAASAEASLLELQRGSRPEELRQAEAPRRGAAFDAKTAERSAIRARELHAKQVLSDQELDQAENALGMRARARSRPARRCSWRRAGPRKERVDAARANAAAANATVRALDATIANTVIHAPFPGVITVRQHHPGEIVQPGAPVLTLLDRTDRWVKVYVPETRIGSVHVGQAAHITTDTFPGTPLPGARVVRVVGSGVHAQDRPDPRGAGEAGVRGEGADRGRSVVRAQARHAGRRRAGGRTVNDGAGSAPRAGGEPAAIETHA